MSKIEAKNLCCGMVMRAPAGDWVKVEGVMVRGHEVTVSCAGYPTVLLSAGEEVDVAGSAA